KLNAPPLSIGHDYRYWTSTVRRPDDGTINYKVMSITVFSEDSSGAFFTVSYPGSVRAVCQLPAGE
ncbi:MAG: hypothetical protein II707_10335, partial [Spirochaetales bacterium]|nr:hypothetical protein [Spirochaetales bacterium]